MNKRVTSTYHTAWILVSERIHNRHYPGTSLDSTASRGKPSGNSVQLETTANFCLLPAAKQYRNQLKYKHIRTQLSFEQSSFSFGSRLRSKLTSSLLSLYTSAYMEQHRRTSLMNSACRRISAHDVAFIQRHHHHWSSAVCICQPLVTELYLLLPHMWNSLLQHVTSASSLPAFHRRLKTHLFERYFHWLLVSCLSSDFVIIHINRSCYLLDLHISK